MSSKWWGRGVAGQATPLPPTTIDHSEKTHKNIPCTFNSSQKLKNAY